ncbi:UpxY family transcription antiterminator [Bacteroides xylanisolvens]
MKIRRDREKSPCIGLTPDALPEVQKLLLAENSQTGVSTKNALSETILEANKKVKEIPHWYALRATYGREKKAYDYLVGKNVEAFYPTITTIKLVGGKRKSVEESRLPNIFFARGTEEEIKSFVYDNVNLPYLRFYYRHFHEEARIFKKPLIVPDYQIESLKIICASEAEDIILVPIGIEKFKTGQKVCVIDGCFKGVEGRVARYHGQQRVAVIISGVLTVATAYIPSAFLKPID